jgi:hypothetical protein
MIISGGSGMVTVRSQTHHNHTVASNEQHLHFPLFHLPRVSYGPASDRYTVPA